MKLTKADIAKIQEEIDYRKVTLGPELRERLKVARAQGDLSENFEYTMAKRENNQNNSRVRYLERMIQTAEIVEDTSAADEVSLNKAVTIYYVEQKITDTVKFVSSIRGDSLNKRLSLESPLGQALKGRHVGDVVDFSANGRTFKVEIKKIEPAPDDGTDELREF